jgi:hypothetical protein
MGVVTHIGEDLVRIKPTDPLRLTNRETVMYVVYNETLM